MSPLSFVSLNIEKRKHLDAVLPFLAKRAADVVCVQELSELDIPAFEKELGASAFLPMWRTADDSPDGDGPGTLVGVGIFSRLPFVRTDTRYYHRAAAGTPTFADKSVEEKRVSQNLGVLLADVEKDGVTYRSASTHFTWTPDGEADEYQRQDVRTMLDLLESEGEYVLCGDFNAPRGKEIFSAISAKLKDNVPSEYETSIDGNIHRAGALPYMVDGLFSTPGYAVSDVEMHCGVSDHCALTATIRRA
ncbi:MAG: endonuclease/exonuclease/phosphatase family protein [Patescibacteria group bacterium]|nr:endonuclease/exonuclease/phosphatase family protein [Patescibacteria group bacterium]MDE1965691.1 endonuclease/exonuclease/phosphatase family protein [Patescibacteria group bacterium]